MSLHSQGSVNAVPDSVAELADVVAIGFGIERKADAWRGFGVAGWWRRRDSG
jgi:hypothetical protein